MVLHTTLIALSILGGSYLSGCVDDNRHAPLTQDLDKAADPMVTERNLCTLDSLVRNHDTFLIAKQRRINALKAMLPAENDIEEYGIYDRLFSEYYSFDLDSAYSYANRKIKTARKTGDKMRETISFLNLARISLSKGRGHEAIQAVEHVLPDTADAVVRNMYYDFMSVYFILNSRNPYPWYKKLSASLDTASPAWVYNECAMLKAAGDIDGAMSVLVDNRGLITGNPHSDAITSHIAGQICLERGDTATAINHFTLSAINDLRTPVRDYKSLYELAALLMATGDIERAYRYINIAVDDVNAAKALDNMVAVNNIMPQIVRAHDRQIKREKHIQWLYLGGISLLSVFLVAALILTVRSRNDVGKAADREKELNRRLRKINGELQDLNGELQAMNGRIAESNRVKDAYLVQYFNLCSYFIGCLEQFKNSVSATAKTKGIEGIEKLLARTDDDRELKKFYSNFDSTFLSLFPGFIDQFNALLASDRQVTLNRDGSMPNELRTFALIRLGVDDSDQIAEFLRRSVSTIYNYRVKMRNSAIGPRDQFEAKVKEIHP